MRKDKKIDKPPTSLNRNISKYIFLNNRFVFLVDTFFSLMCFFLLVLIFTQVFTLSLICPLPPLSPRSFIFPFHHMILFPVSPPHTLSSFSPLLPPLIIIISIISIIIIIIIIIIVVPPSLTQPESHYLFQRKHIHLFLISDKSDELLLLLLLLDANKLRLL